MVFYFYSVAMKKSILGIMVIFSVLPLFSFAQDSSWGKYGGNPIQVLDNVVSEANDDYKIQQTALDQATDKP